MSDIRVAVQWNGSTVFAGEEIECTITFKNVSEARNVHRSPSPNPPLSYHGISRERWKETLPLRSKQASSTHGHERFRPAHEVSKSSTRVHKPNLSLSTSHDLSAGATLMTAANNPQALDSKNYKHRRSISIVSIGGDTFEEDPSPGPLSSSGRPLRSHVRAASAQILSKASESPSSTSPSANGSNRAFTAPYPFVRSLSSFANPKPASKPISRPQPHVAYHNGLIPPNRNQRVRPSFPEFRFFPEGEIATKVSENISVTPIKESSVSQLQSLPPNSHEATRESAVASSSTKVLSPSILDETPRSSGDFYSLSNNSTETLASEYVTHESGRLMTKAAHNRQGSSLATTKTLKPEVLMMGYAQLSGSLILDGSLVNQNPFEEAKKKKIVGRQGGGGVVRTESRKRDSGLLGTLAWSNIGESLGGFLTNNEVSTIKETKNAHNGRSIPILSTPQSVLFVDLKLGPGESRSYNYRHPLPRGIPPTYKGRAIKISYHLTIGTQRATKLTSPHQMQHADVPFRVLTGVNEQGEILGHDLMAPHTILSDIASISSPQKLSEPGCLSAASSPFVVSDSSPGAFLSYIKNLLAKQTQNSGSNLLSPTEVEPSSSAFMAEIPSKMQDSIDLAIFRSNAVTSSKRSTIRFEIARSSEKVAAIMLARPAYRLGEIVPVVIDLQDSDVQCYSLHATLETTESIDPGIALRSKASIQRATRRVHAAQFECTIAAKKVLFNPMIPLTSAPEFITSGVSLEWRLRFEFSTSCARHMEGDVEGAVNLVEDVARDERGSVKAAVQGLSYETFDVLVPLRVYGATGGFDEKREPAEFSI